MARIKVINLGGVGNWEEEVKTAQHLNKCSYFKLTYFKFQSNWDLKRYENEMF